MFGVLNVQRCKKSEIIKDFYNKILSYIIYYFYFFFFHVNGLNVVS